PAGIRPPSVEAFKDIVSEWPELGVYAEKVAEVEREAVGKYKSGLHTGPSGVGGHGEGGAVTAPATSEAARWDGWGTALKPAIEPIILSRKPLDGTVANNVLAHGVGGLNIDACRVPSGESGTAGRFPANVLLDEHAAKEMDKQSGWLKSGALNTYKNANRDSYSGGMPEVRHVNSPANEGGASRFFPVFKSEGETPETKGRFPANVLLDEHAAAEMDEQSGPAGAHGESRGGGTRGMLGWQSDNRQTTNIGVGGASRFFPVFKYQAKAPKKERPVIEREDGSKIQHATVKPLALMEWLVSLIVPPGGV